MSKVTKKEYESGQNYTKINTFLHQRRYNVLLNLLNEFKASHPEKTQ
jgi:hypothetical protein